MSFNTNENKVLLWDVLKDTGKFNSLTPSLQKGIKFEFENILQMFALCFQICKF